MGRESIYVFDWKFFELLYSRYNQHAKLWLTWYNDIPVSGASVFIHNRSIFLFQSASMSEYRYLRPVNLENINYQRRYSKRIKMARSGNGREE
jgi:hypothetical protein